MCKYLGRKCPREFPEFAEFLPHVDIALLVEQDGEEGLCAAGILDGLASEEEILGAVVVESSVSRDVGLGLAGGVFEEEDDAVDGTTRVIDGKQSC